MDANSDRRPTSCRDLAEGSEVKVRYFEPGDEQQIFDVLQACHPDTWGKQDIEQWRWKHIERPGFKPEDIVVVTVDGKVVACFHSAVMPLQLEPGLTVPVSFDGDYGVIPEHRGRDITGQAYAVSDNNLLERAVVLRGGFTSRELNERLYRKRFGYMFVPTSRSAFRKILGLAPLRPKLARLGERLLMRPVLRLVLSKKPLVTNVFVQGLPPAHVVMASDAFHLRDGNAEDPDLAIQLPYNELAAFSEGSRQLLKGFALGVLSGRIRFRGLLRCGPRLMSIAWALLRSR